MSDLYSLFDSATSRWVTERRYWRAVEMEIHEDKLTEIWERVDVWEERQHGGSVFVPSYDTHSFFLSLSISGFLTQRLLRAPFISSIHAPLYLPHPLMFDRWHCFPASPSPLLLFNGRAVEVPCCCGTVGAIYSRG